MLYMVIERFKNGDAGPVGERFRQRGRMMPEGLAYHASWIDAAGAACFQIMEADDPDLLKAWTSQWNDLVDFEIIPVQTPTDFWQRISGK
jgi:hypothetical protein